MEGGRALLSCALCRQRKLKCDRNVPCSNCIARKTTCVFSPQSRNRISGARTEAKQQFDSRIRRLEQLVNSMVSQSSQSQSPGSTNRDERIKKSVTGSPNGLESEAEIESGRIVSSNDQTIYVSGAHWASICYEVADIREHFDRSNQEDPANVLGSDLANGPMLLEGLGPAPDIESILSDMPPQDITNKLVSRYFNGAEFPVVILHTPTFEQEYRNFWLRPEKAPIPWIGLLFGVLSMGVFLCRRSAEGLPEALGPAGDAMDAFHRRCTQCLVLSKYFTTPGPYTIEALLVSQQLEFLRSKDARLGVWLMGGVVIRLALRMGYHRDPVHYPRISVFDGEMRRRVWALIIQLDALTSYQLGLPAMIQDLHCDTKPPRNLLDEDFGPDSAQLPPSRPESEVTPVLYTVNKAKLSACFRDIFSRVSLGGTEDYMEIMALHHRLCAAKDSISPRLRMSSFQDAVTVPPHLLLRRITLDLLFHKTTCMLHRRHMTKSFQEPKFTFSRSSCVEAAMAILAMQSDILDEEKYGYLFRESKGLLSSLEQTDFILAGTIICLELSSRSVQSNNLSQRHDSGAAGNGFSDEELIKALQTTLYHLGEMKGASAECQQAFEIVSILARKLGRWNDYHEVEQHAASSLSGTSDLDWSTANEAPAQTPQNPQVTNALSPNAQFERSTFEGIESFLENPENADWEFWEAIMRNSPPRD